jgi:hypothetical protein
MGWRKSIAVGGSIVLLAASAARAQELRIDAGPVELGFTGRLQFQFNSTSVSGAEAGLSEDPAETTFETRRVRFATTLAVDEWITGMIEADFAMGRLQLRQVFLDLGFSDAVALRAGQWKKPFSLIELTSSARIPTIERAVRIRGLAEALGVQDTAGVLTQVHDQTLLGEEQYLLTALGYHSFDMGAALHGELGSFGYQAGVFNGTGSDRADQNAGKSFAARVTYSLPIEAPLRLGAGVSRRDHLRTIEDVQVTENGTAWEMDLEWGAYRRPGLWLLAEATAGSNLVDGSFRAAQTAATYFVPTGHERVEGVEPVFRLSWGDPDVDVDGDAGVLLTPGFNLHFHDRNKLMFNWDFYVPEGDVLTPEHALRAQAQLFF